MICKKKMKGVDFKNYPLIAGMEKLLKALQNPPKKHNMKETLRDYEIPCSHKKFLKLKKQMETQDYVNDKIIIESIEYNPVKGVAKIRDKVKVV